MMQMCFLFKDLVAEWRNLCKTLLGASAPVASLYRRCWFALSRSPFIIQRPWRRCPGKSDICLLSRFCFWLWLQNHNVMGPFIIMARKNWLSDWQLLYLLLSLLSLTILMMNLCPELEACPSVFSFLWLIVTRHWHQFGVSYSQRPWPWIAEHFLNNLC